MKSPSNLQVTPAGRFPLAPAIQLVIAALVLCWSGFFTMDFLLSGVYTWPRASQTIALSLAGAILSYEFVYKEERARAQSAPGLIPIKSVVYFCFIPYLFGSFALLALLKVG